MDQTRSMHSTILTTSCTVVISLLLLSPTNPFADARNGHSADMGSALLPSSSTQGEEDNSQTSLSLALIPRHQLEMQHGQHSTISDLIVASVQWDEMRVKGLHSSNERCRQHAYRASSPCGRVSHHHHHHRENPIFPSFSPSDAIASSHPSSASTASRKRPAFSPPMAKGAKREHFKGMVVSGASFPGNIGQYFVELFVGTPHQRFLFITDTGSDLVWIPCSLCRSCESNQSNMTSSALSSSTSFYPEASSTFTPITCSSHECTLIPPPPGATCNPRSPTNCTYTYAYSDLSQTTGIFAYDTITMRSSTRATPTRLDNVALGCGTNNTGPSITKQGGVLGLGQGPISFSTQFGHKYENKFSYCFTTFFHKKLRGALVFGDSRGSVKLADDLQFTPFIPNSVFDTFYHVQVDSIKVDKETLPIKSSVFKIDENGNGGFIIDSGTTLTFFAKPAFRLIFKAFKKRVSYPRASPTAGLQMCYNVSKIAKPRFPRIAIVFKGRAVFRPPPRNFFLSPTKEVRCLGFMPNNGASVLGNLMQQNYYVEYDRQHNQFGFAKAHCSASS